MTSPAERSTAELWAAARRAVEESGIPVFPALPETPSMALPWLDDDPEGFVDLGAKLRVRLFYLEESSTDSGAFRAGVVQWAADGLVHSWSTGDMSAFEPDPPAQRPSLRLLDDDLEWEAEYERANDLAKGLAAREDLASARSPKEIEEIIGRLINEGQIDWPAKRASRLAEAVKRKVITERLPSYVDTVFTDSRFQGTSARKRSRDVVREILAVPYRVWGWSIDFNEVQRQAEDRWDHQVAPEAKRLRDTGMSKSNVAARLGIGTVRLDRILMYAVIDPAPAPPSPDRSAGNEPPELF